jgi:general secretion pathway protein K
MTHRHPARRGRRGFALLAVLWIIACASMLVLGTSLVARQSISAAQNRVDMARATWKAEGCLEEARAVIAAAMSGRTADVMLQGVSWNTLDRAVARAFAVAPGGCEVRLRAVGTAINLAEADGELVRRILTEAVVPNNKIDSLVDALLDWRDADDVARPHGAERNWYRARGRHPPRNAPLADVRELSRVAGFDSVSGLDTFFTTESGRISINHAPVVVLAALPGFSEEVAGRAAERRLRGIPVGDLLALSTELSPAARSALSARYTDLLALTTTEPDAWILTSTASSGGRGVSVTIEVRLARSGTRAAVVRRRTWVG